MRVTRPTNATSPSGLTRGPSTYGNMGKYNALGSSPRVTHGGDTRAEETP
jgi:hypothetical protein